MHAAGPQGPLPATDAVIEGLPRIVLDEKTLGEGLPDGAHPRIQHPQRLPDLSRRLFSRRRGHENTLRVSIAAAFLTSDTSSIQTAYNPG